MSFVKKVCLPSSQEGLLERDRSACRLPGLGKPPVGTAGQDQGRWPQRECGDQKTQCVCAPVSMCVCACVYVQVPRASVYTYMSVYAASKEIEIMTQSLAM